MHGSTLSSPRTCASACTAAESRSLAATRSRKTLNVPTPLVMLVVLLVGWTLRGPAFPDLTLTHA